MIIFLYGEDSFRSKQKLNALRNKYLQTDLSGSGLSVFDCEEEEKAFEKIKNTASTSNLLAPKRLVIIKNPILARPVQEQKDISDFLKNKEEDLVKDQNLVLIFWEKNQPKKNGELYKFLEKKAQKQNFEKLAGLKLKAWVLKTISEINPEKKISNLALEKLIAYANSDSFLLFYEIQKLVNYVESKMISEKDVELLVKSGINSNIFATIDALGKNDKKEALRLIYGHLEKGDDPFYLMSMFFYQFRNMLKISDLLEKNIRSEYEISRVTKLHPFVVKKSLWQVQNFSFFKLKNIYKKLSELDTAIKTGQIGIQLALDKFVAEI